MGRAIKNLISKFKREAIHWNVEQHLYRGENGINLINQRVEIIRGNIARINIVQTPHHVINQNLQNIIVIYANKIIELEALKVELENNVEQILQPERELFVHENEAVLDENVENLERAQNIDDAVVRDDDSDFDEFIEDDDVGLIDYIDDNFDIHVEDNFDPDVMLNPSTLMQNVILLENFVREHNIIMEDAKTLVDAGFGIVHGLTLNQDVRMYRPGDIMTKRHCYTMMRQLDPWPYKSKLFYFYSIYFNFYFHDLSITFSNFSMTPHDLIFFNYSIYFIFFMNSRLSRFRFRISQWRDSNLCSSHQ